MVSHNRLPPNNKTKGVVKLLLSHGEGAVKLLLTHGEGVVKLLLTHREGAVKLLLTHGEGVVKLLLTHPMGGGEGFPGCTSGRVPQPQPNGGGRGPPRLQQRPGPSNSPLARVKARVWWKTPDPGWISSAPRVGVKARAWCHLPGPGWISPDSQRGGHRPDPWPGPTQQPNLRPTGKETRTWRQKLTDSGGTPSRSLSNIHQTNRLPGLKGTTLTYISTRQQKLHGAEPRYRGIQLNTTTKKQ